MKILLNINFGKLLLLTLSVLLSSNILINAQTSGAANTVYVEPTDITHFIKKLSELGKNGYQLKVVKRYSQFAPPEDALDIKIAGIAELRQGDFFEYDWFNAVDIPDVLEQINPSAEKGYYFKDRIPYTLAPWNDLPEVTAPTGTPENDRETISRSAAIISKNFSQKPIDGSIFILERKNKIKAHIEYKIATAKPAKSIFNTSVITKRVLDQTLQQSVDEIDTQEFYPVCAFFSSSKFMTRVSHLPVYLFQYREQAAAGKTAYKAVGIGYELVRTFKKQLRDSAKDGRNIDIIDFNFALVSSTGRKVDYSWINPFDKESPQTIAKLSSKGGRYVIDQNDLDLTTLLIFETPLNDDGSRYEYQILNLSGKPKKVKGGSQGDVLIETPEQAKQKLEELVKQGYTVRNLFYGGGTIPGMDALLERPIQIP